MNPSYWVLCDFWCVTALSSCHKPRNPKLYSIFPCPLDNWVWAHDLGSVNQILAYGTLSVAASINESVKILKCLCFLGLLAPDLLMVTLPAA